MYLEKLCPPNSEASDDDLFEGHPYDIEEFEAMLSDGYDGPISAFLKEAYETSSGEEMAVSIMGIKVVEQFSAALATIDREHYAPLDIVMGISSHTMDESHRQDFYDEIAAAVDKLKIFVASAAREKCEIKMYGG